ncbi:peptidoglycan glycosyltransferase [Arboricoccus pini]|uniref:Peptidoglycan glycosyltransferase n=1 Tax=Arboricoccus pini TaxID=1963835 RepID=A0A212QPP9_9PROT|nr:penicillin-binding protein 2 [Arboricoccus pini]SNB61413.1 peptidoglycan glycosyltransferase [Arboricoccus pini]
MRQETERARSFTRRACLVGAAELGLFGMLSGRLWQLQVKENEQYRLLAENNRANERLIVPPRGRILDLRGRPLAQNIPTYRVRVVREQARDLKAVLANLARFIALDQAHIDEIVARAARQRAFLPTEVRNDLTFDEVAKIAVNSPELPGVLLDQGLLRSYPAGDLFSHVLGYTGPASRDDIERETDPLFRLPDFRTGKAGIERAYDAELRGKAGIERLEVNAIGREIRELDNIEGDSGDDLTLSIDLDLQRYAFERLSEHRAAAAVIVEIATGAVRCMASVPSYDPGTFTNPLPPDVWAALRDDPAHPLINKCVRGQYPPGSTFKMMTALAALEAGVVTPQTRVNCPGSMQLGNLTFHCWRKGGHGSLNIVQAIAHSCDVFFYEMARRVGVDTLAQTSHRFGLGAPLGIDLPGEQGGIVPTVAWKKKRFGQAWQRGETLITGIGQGYMLTTPLQLAVMTARLANGGREVHPWLVRGKDAHVAEGTGGNANSLGLKPENLKLVLQGMFDVVNANYGTGRGAAIPQNGIFQGIRLAGKSGTAQVRRISMASRLSGAYKRKNRPWEELDHALFVAFAPFDDPKYAAGVIVEHGEGGAKVAGPVARDLIMKAIELDHLNGPLTTAGRKTDEPA